MSKKKKVVKKPETVYRCRWCERDKVESRFFKCSIQHKSYVCTDCIKEKYRELNNKCEKYLAIFICCSDLNIAFYWDIYKSLEIGQGIGYYVRQLNLVQNMLPDTFEEGIIKNNIIDYTPKDMKMDKVKDDLTNIIKSLENIKNDL